MAILVKNYKALYQCTARTNKYILGKSLPCNV